MFPHVDGQVGAAEVLGLALATTESLPITVVCCHVDLESRAADETLASTTLLGAIVGALAGVLHHVPLEGVVVAELHVAVLALEVLMLLVHLK